MIKNEYYCVKTTVLSSLLLKSITQEMNQKNYFQNYLLAKYNLLKESAVKIRQPYDRFKELNKLSRIIYTQGLAPLPELCNIQQKFTVFRTIVVSCQNASLEFVIHLQDSYAVRVFMVQRPRQGDGILRLKIFMPRRIAYIQKKIFLSRRVSQQTKETEV